MKDNKGADPGASLSVGPDHIRAQVSNRTLEKLGSAAKWLFPKKDARAKITATMALRVAEKIKAGSLLEPQELDFIALVFEKDARALANREAVAYKVHEVLPEVAGRRRESQLATADTVDETFIARAENIASETMGEQIREIFARVLAGEISLPGSISLRTLEAVRMMDQGLASTFDKARRFAFGNEVILLEGEIGKIVVNHGLSWGSFLDLQDAGLVDPGFSQLPMTFGDSDKEIIWEYQDKTLRMRMRKSGAVCLRPMPARRLTRTGREIARVLPTATDEEYFSKCYSLLSQILGHCASVEWKHIGETHWHEK